MQNIIDDLRGTTCDEIRGRLSLAKMFRMRNTMKALESILYLFQNQLINRETVSVFFKQNEIDGILQLVVLNHGERGQEIANLLK